MNSRTHSYYLIVMAFFVLVGIMSVPVSAQDEGTPIEITGIVSSMSPGTLIVAGMTVDVSSVDVDVNITVGTTVTVTGNLLPGNIIVAQVVVIRVVNIPPEATPEATPETTPEVTATVTPTPDPDLTVVIEGPVINIINNIITIYNFDVEVENNHPILTIIDIGDIIHVEGVIGSGGIVTANVISNVTNTTTVVNNATVNLDGPVETINGNTLVVNGITVQLSPDDPLLLTLQPGDFVNVQGNFEGSGTTIILIVVNIVIINNVTIIENDCWYHEGGMGMGMGHWHCDGMGMGMGDDAMGMGMGG